MSRLEERHNTSTDVLSKPITIKPATSDVFLSVFSGDLCWQVLNCICYSWWLCCQAHWNRIMYLLHAVLSCMHPIFLKFYHIVLMGGLNIATFAEAYMNHLHMVILLCIDLFLLLVSVNSAERSIFPYSMCTSIWTSQTVPPRGTAPNNDESRNLPYLPWRRSSRPSLTRQTIMLALKFL